MNINFLDNPKYDPISGVIVMSKIFYDSGVVIMFKIIYDSGVGFRENESLLF